MHNEILSDKQTDLLPFVSQFKRSFYLVGGTAIALHIGHRRSVDFDLFAPARLNQMRILQKMSFAKGQKILIFKDIDQLHYYINEVKVTFFQYPYAVPHPVKFDNVISVPSLLSLAAMKAFALGRRAKWKDYIDLYFIIKDFFCIAKIAAEAARIFGDLFSEKLFRQQLAFHKDIDYSEEVEYMNGFQIKDEEVKAFLIDKALEF
ncbi:hypothetical protein FACS1894201_10150 [Bacteroidia bacterium]|nr:hypothetical protein FACS1894201_10150 [Bacteroidia bacterium]